MRKAKWHGGIQAYEEYRLKESWAIKHSTGVYIYIWAPIQSSYWYYCIIDNLVLTANESSWDQGNYLQFLDEVRLKN